MAEDTKLVRVLFVVDSTFPGAGGAEAQARKLGIALKAKNTVIEFVSPQTLPHLAINDSVDGTPNHRIGYPHIKILGAGILLMRFAWYLYKRRNDFDIIHVHITRLLAAVAVAMRSITGVPVVTKISGYFEFKGGVLDTNAINPANALLRRLLLKIDYVQTISEQTREKLIGAGFTSEQIRFIPNGVDTAESIRLADVPTDKQRSASDPLVFGYCGRLREIKGIHILLESFKEFSKTQPKGSVKLRIAGGGVLLTELNRSVEDEGYENCIDFLGSIDETYKFYNSLDVYIQPSFAEGLPNSVMEAMVSGLPVLATDIGGNNDLVTHEKEGWLFEANDAPALTASMQRCVRERESLKTMGLAGRERIVKTYDFESVTKDLLELYRG